ncbi:LysM domain-containing protein [Colletotrichum plurivorum]|uniref:LysM domain-containing protein n=1 Tax=Colletotrichum plurivorum TaxID=2175906 RepID=A0A8H6JDJ8_9PEZI|nr:LysM domain-containing protein [Colletotrichum plurivorum]
MGHPKLEGSIDHRWTLPSHHNFQKSLSPGNCKRFHFVQPGQNCDIISRQYGISLANFIRWNPAAGANCQGLWAQTYACVGL